MSISLKASLILNTVGGRNDYRFHGSPVVGITSARFMTRITSYFHVASGGFEAQT
jgi:hypothetical protein